MATYSGQNIRIVGQVDVSTSANGNFYTVPANSYLQVTAINATTNNIGAATLNVTISVNGLGVWSKTENSVTVTQLQVNSSYIILPPGSVISLGGNGNIASSARIIGVLFANNP
jgi:hypothetical protein